MDERVVLDGWTPMPPLPIGARLVRVVIEPSFLYNVDRDKIMMWVWRNLGRDVMGGQ